MKLVPLIAFLVCLASPPASAEVNGFVFARVSVDDPRTPADGRSFLPDTRPARARVAGVLVEVTPLSSETSFDDDGLDPVNQRSFYGRTDENGFVPIFWTDDRFEPTEFPRPVAVSVIWESPDIEDAVDLEVDSQITIWPRARFGIHPEFGRQTTVMNRFVVTAQPVSSDDDVAITLVDLDYAGTDFSTAFLTGEEYYRRVIDGLFGGGVSRDPSLLVSDRMKDVAVFLSPTLFGGRGIAPDAASAHVLVTLAETDPFTIAHELSHVLTWNAFDYELAPIFPTQFCFNQTLDCVFVWARDTQEHERIAWLEGIADAFAGLWLWDVAEDPPRRIPRSVRRGIRTYRDDNNIEVVIIDPTSNVLVNLDGEFVCQLDGLLAQHRIPMCQAAAMWDILDDPPNDDDPFSGFQAVSSAVVFSAFDEYRDSGCDPFLPNHCSIELGDNGLNHHDFAFNFTHPLPEPREEIQERSDAIAETYALNGIERGTP